MFEDLAEIVRLLQARAVPHALIGAAAMVGLGVVRASDDVDLLVTDRAVLAHDFWAPLAGRMAIEVDARLSALPAESLALWRTIGDEG